MSFAMPAVGLAGIGGHETALSFLRPGDGADTRGHFGSGARLVPAERTPAGLDAAVICFTQTALRKR